MWPTLVSTHTYESNYACMNVWVHAGSDWSARNRVWMMGGDGDLCAVSGWTGGGMGLAGTGWRMEEDHGA